MSTREQAAAPPPFEAPFPDVAAPSPAAPAPAPIPESWKDRGLTVPGVSWEEYVKVNDAFVERQPARMIYSEGRLTFVVTSRRHDWAADFLGDVVKVVASGCGLEWEIAGRATFRKEEVKGGIEGDQTFYFGEHAVRMRGPINIDPSSQPPPDLAIEVEVSHPADHALVTWGRLGVPEVWRFDAETRALSYWLRQEDGSYARSPSSLALPMLNPGDILAQMQVYEEFGPAR